MARDLSRGRLIVVTIGVMMALLLAALDQTIVGTAMPRIVAELNGIDRYAWVLTAYMVASTTMTPISGKLGDLFGRKPFLLVGMFGFVGVSALCGLSQDMTQLIAFRAVQGFFGGILFSTVFAVLADLFPPKTRARMQGLFGGVWGLASVLGPTLGGYLTDNLSWRWVFYINLPLGIAAILVVLFAMPFIRTKATVRDIDFAGAFTLAATLVPFLVALSITVDHDWTSPQVVGLLVVAAAMCVLFVLAERRTDHPIVPFSLFRDRTFAVSMLVGFLVSFGMFGTIVFVPLLYQGVLGVAATNSGLLLTPMTFGLMAASIATGQLMTRVRYYRFIGTAGIAIMAAGMWMLSRISTSTTESEVVRDIVVVGLGLGTTMPLYINAVQSAISTRFLGVATSQIQFWRNVGGTVGVAVLGSQLGHRLPEEVRAQVATLALPPQASGFLAQMGQSSQTLFEPAQIAAARAQVPPAFQPAFDQVLGAVREGLATTLSELFLIGMAVTLVAIVASVFLEDVPLRAHHAREREMAPAFGE